MFSLRPSLPHFVMVSALLLGGCDPAAATKAKDAEQGAKDQQTPVLVERAKLGAIEASLTSASTIEAERQVTVHAESTGRIVKLPIEEGDEVAARATLARIKYDAQAAMLDRAANGLSKAKADLATVEQLVQQGVASKDELTQARLAFKTARLDVRDGRRDVRNTQVRAPFAGTVTERFVVDGAFVTAGAQLLTITDFSTLVARVYVPEKELDRIQKGQLARVHGKAARSRKGQGTVLRIAPIVDPVTGTVKVTVALPPELCGGPTGFLPGMYAEVKLTTEQHDNVVLISKRSLVREGDEAFVFVLEDDTAKRVLVTLGLQDAEHAEVLKGISVGDEIVISGQAGLKDGGLVVRVDASGTVLEHDQQAGEQDDRSAKDTEVASRSAAAGAEASGQP